MSFGFRSAADRLLRTTDLPSWGVGAMISEYGKFRFDDFTGGLQTAFTLLLDDVSAYIFVGLLPDGTLYYETSNGENFSGPQLVPDTDYSLAYTWWAGHGAEFFVNSTSVGAASANPLAGTPARMERGGWRSTNGNHWNGDQTIMKTWLSILTQTDLAAEDNLAVPQITDNLYGAWYLQNVADVADRSGNGRDWTVLGDPVTGDPFSGVTYPSSGISIPVVMYNRKMQGMS